MKSEITIRVGIRRVRGAAVARFKAKCLPPVYVQGGDSTRLAGLTSWSESRSPTHLASSARKY